MQVLGLIFPEMESKWGCGSCRTEWYVDMVHEAFVLITARDRFRVSLRLATKLISRERRGLRSGLVVGLAVSSGECRLSRDDGVALPLAMEVILCLIKARVRVRVTIRVTARDRATARVGVRVRVRVRGVMSQPQSLG